jgi:3',5'-cyclic-AMP phosphodiesterase
MRRCFIVILTLSALHCRANYRDWHAPECSIVKPDLTILQFSDTHVRHAVDAAWMAEKLHSAIAKYKPDVLVHTGDITLEGKNDEWLAFAEGIKALKPEPLLVWGNHDMPLKQTGYKTAGLTRFKDFGNYRLVLIDTAWDGWFVGSYTSVPESEFPALEKAAETDKQLILFAHHPLGKDAPHFRLNNAEQVLKVFTKNRIAGVFTGHFHGAYLAPEGKTLFAGVVPLSSHQRNHTWSQSKGYRIIELERGCLRTQHVILE